MLLKLYTAAVARLAALADPEEADRGDSPVSTAVIVALLAAAAVTVAGIITAAATRWANAIP